SAETSEHSTTEQHAEKARAEEACGEAAQHAHAGPVEEPATGRCGTRARRLGDGAVERLCRIWRGRSAWRRGKRSRSPGTRTEAAADAGVDLRGRHYQGERERHNDGHRPNDAVGALRKIHVKFLKSPTRGPLLTWAGLPKSEAVIGTHR